MITGLVSRRTALLALTGLLGLAKPAEAAGGLQPLPTGLIAQVRLKAIRVDVSRLVENANGPAAEWLSQDLPALLQNAFARHMTPREPPADILLVRIDSIVLGQPRSREGLFSGFRGSNATDSIEGAGIILSPRGKVIATYPLLSSVQTSVGVIDNDIQFQRDRVASLARSFAWWLPGQMGL